MLNDRSRRIADLFVEGTECFLGQGDDGSDVIVWVNKVNSFEAEDARRDAAVERGRRIAQLSKADSPELVGLLSQVKAWPSERLAANRVDNQMINDLSLQALNDIEVDHRELMDRVRRQPELLDDAGASDGDERRKALLDDQNKYFELLRDRQKTLRDQALETVTALKRSDLEAQYVEAWREREALEGYLEERRISELFFAMRDCQGVRLKSAIGKPKWDHSKCDHNARLLAERREVRSFPEGALDKIIEVLDNLPVDSRESGNLVAPESSSESSEQPRKAEESTASTPEETSPVAPTT